MKNEITKKEALKAIIEMALGQEENWKTVVGDKEVTAADVIEYAEKTIDQLDSKADKAKVKAAEKKNDDGLQTAVYAALTNENQVIDQILEKIDFEDATKAKVVARLTALVKAGVAVKEEIKIEGRKGKVMAYRLTTENDETGVE